MTKAATTEPMVPAGWTIQPFPDTFSAHAGPFYFRDYAEKQPGCGFVSEPRHANAGGIVHGGALLTLADMSLWDICRREIGRFHGVTVTLNSEFLAPGPIGKFIMATGETTKVGKSLMFARGTVACDGDVLLAFSGTLKRIRPR